MMPDRPRTTLGAVASDVSYGFTASATRRDTGVRFLRTTDIVRASINWTDVPFCELESAEFAKYKLLHGDIVISRMGTVGASALVRPPHDSVFASYLVRFRIDPEIAVSAYVAKALRSPGFWEYVASRSTGSVQPNFNAKLMREFAFPLPAIPVQEAIAATLGALDDKIESNRRLIGICSSLLDATSSSFALDVDSVPLSDLAQPMRDAFNPTSLGTGLIDHFSIPAFDAQGLPDRTTGSSVISAKLRVDRPAVLVSRLNPKTNRTWFAVPEPGVPAGCSTEFLVLAPKAGMTLGSLWLAVRDEGFRSLLAQRVTGTSGSHQRVKPLDALATEVPDVRQLLASDVQAADELLSLMHQRRIETTRLAALRDALLPELLSGRIWVPEAGEAVESALA